MLTDDGRARPIDQQRYNGHFGASVLGNQNGRTPLLSNVTYNEITLISGATSSNSGKESWRRYGDRGDATGSRRRPTASRTARISADPEDVSRGVRLNGKGQPLFPVRLKRKRWQSHSRDIARAIATTRA